MRNARPYREPCSSGRESAPSESQSRLTSAATVQGFNARNPFWGSLSMNSIPNNRWLHRFAVLTALATLGLIGIGGLVTSHEAGMSVPDWPNSYGYNMFLFPPSKWVGGILYEHTHRLWASTVGLLVVALMRWLGGSASRRPLAIVGAIEILAGLSIFILGPHLKVVLGLDLKATGGFLTGTGGIVLLAALV